ncbi:MAG: hypothetical protein Q9165_001541 [Trypethelium subeluteriae]
MSAALNRVRYPPQTHVVRHSALYLSPFSSPSPSPVSPQSLRTTRPSTNPIPPSRPPYEYWHDGGVLAGLNDLPRQLARQARKAVHLPASSSAASLASMLGCLRTGAQQELPKHAPSFPDIAPQDLKVTHGVLSTPDFVALYDEDVRDAADYAGVTLLQEEERGGYFARQPRHAAAAFVGYGLNGELTREELRNATRRKGDQVEKRNVVVAYLTRSVLEVSCETKWTNRTCPLAWAQHVDYFRPDLGWPLQELKHYEDGGVGRWKEYQEEVKALVRDCVEAEIRNKYVNGGDVNVTDVLMLGENGGSRLFGGLVEGALKDLQTQTPRWYGLVEQGGVDTGEAVWKASEGAAQIAWRLLIEPSLEGDDYECGIEQRRKLTNANGIRY